MGEYPEFPIRIVTGWKQRPHGVEPIVETEIWYSLTMEGKAESPDHNCGPDCECWTKEKP